MKRRFNYTGRSRIPQGSVTIDIREEKNGPLFDASLDLGPLALPPDAHVFVEAYRRMEWMRFDFGTVAQLLPPADRYLRAFDSLEGVLFRVRVVVTAESEAGRLVGEADRIPARLPKPKDENRRTLLPLEPVSLQGELFRVDFSEGPRLLVERDLGGDWQSAAGSPAFEALVYPQVLRAILSEMLHAGWPDDDPDAAGWQSDWALLVRRLPGFTEPPAAEDEHDDWKDRIVEAFCRQYRMLDRFNNAWSGGSAQ